MNKTQDILNYLKENPMGITSMEAIQMFGATSLADIIFRLRKKHIIQENSELVKTRYKKKNGENRVVNVSRYTYKHER